MTKEEREQARAYLGMLQEPIVPDEKEARELLRNKKTALAKANLFLELAARHLEYKYWDSPVFRTKSEVIPKVGTLTIMCETETLAFKVMSPHFHRLKNKVMVTYKELQMIRFYAERVFFFRTIIHALCEVIGEKCPLEDSIVCYDYNKHPKERVL